MDNQLYQHSLFLQNVELLRTDEKISLSYQRVKLIVQTYRRDLSGVPIFTLLTPCDEGLTAEDIRSSSPKFWAIVTDTIFKFALDIAMFTILVSHAGLAIGILKAPS